MAKMFFTHKRCNGIGVECWAARSPEPPLFRGVPSPTGKAWTTTLQTSFSCLTEAPNDDEEESVGAGLISMTVA